MLENLILLPSPLNNSNTLVSFNLLNDLTLYYITYYECELTINHNVFIIMHYKPFKNGTPSGDRVKSTKKKLNMSYIHGKLRFL